MMGFPSRAEVDSLKKRYPAGARIMLDYMGNDPNPIPSGTEGTVSCVDDAGTIHCLFDNGRCLGLIPGEDSFHVIEEKGKSSMNIRPVTDMEKLYLYTQSGQLIGQTGNIGYLRADMDTGGDGFFSTWNDFQENLKTQEFKDDLDMVITSLRLEKNEINFLKNRVELGRYCYSYPDAAVGDMNEYGFRIDTGKYSYLMRVTPNKGEYNLYCYCYISERLNYHLKEAERGIRFIDTEYKDLFVIPDGGKIRISYKDGDRSDVVCRYIDSTHLQIGAGNAGIFHICEFAEHMAYIGAKVEPLSEYGRFNNERVGR